MPSWIYRFEPLTVFPIVDGGASVSPLLPARPHHRQNARLERRRQGWPSVRNGPKVRIVREGRRSRFRSPLRPVLRPAPGITFDNPMRLHRLCVCRTGLGVWGSQVQILSPRYFRKEAALTQIERLFSFMAVNCDLGKRLKKNDTVHDFLRDGAGNRASLWRARRPLARHFGSARTKSSLGVFVKYRNSSGQSQPCMGGSSQR